MCLTCELTVYVASRATEPTGRLLFALRAFHYPCFILFQAKEFRVDVCGFLYCFFNFSDCLEARPLSWRCTGNLGRYGMLIPILTSCLKRMLFLDDDYARPKTIHAGLGCYSRFPEPDEAQQGRRN
jgi:hypothetical protein